jgi:hypothetical protein
MKLDRPSSHFCANAAPARPCFVEITTHSCRNRCMHWSMRAQGRSFTSPSRWQHCDKPLLETIGTARGAAQAGPRVAKLDTSASTQWSCCSQVTFLLAEAMLWYTTPPLHTAVARLVAFNCLADACEGSGLSGFTVRIERAWRRRGLSIAENAAGDRC